jgi:transcriptional regulator with XRE-family HTH domain
MAEFFSDNLRKTREEKGLSQAELAEKAGLQPSAVSHFEAGRRRPSLENLKRLADALNVTLDSLLGREITSAVAGPLAQQLFRSFEQMTAEDQDDLAKFAAVLADKNQRRQKD